MQDRSADSGTRDTSRTRRPFVVASIRRRPALAAAAAARARKCDVVRVAARRFGRFVVADRARARRGPAADVARGECGRLLEPARRLADLGHPDDAAAVRVARRPRRRTSGAGRPRRTVVRDAPASASLLFRPSRQRARQPTRVRPRPGPSPCLSRLAGGDGCGPPHRQRDPGTRRSRLRRLFR